MDASKKTKIDLEEKILTAHQNNDGVKFISEALKKGGKYIVTSKNIKKLKKKIIKVDNEFNFLNHFASQKREKSKAKIIAVTGSAGKTSLKNLIKDQSLLSLIKR